MQNTNNQEPTNSPNDLTIDAALGSIISKRATDGSYAATLTDALITQKDLEAKKKQRKSEGVEANVLDVVEDLASQAIRSSIKAAIFA